MTSPRSSRAEVRNPVLGLPSFRLLQQLSPANRQALHAVLMDLWRDAA